MITYWAFAIFYAVLSIGVVFFGRATPPPRPDVTDLQVEQWFDKHQLGIQIGFTALLVLAGGAAVANGIIGYFMKRMSSGSLLSYAYIAGMGVGAIPGFHMLLVCWLTATYRPDRDPATLHFLYDLGMLSYNGSLGCFTAAYLVLAIAILYDRNKVFPKWFAYISIWQIVTEVLATQMWFFRSGAFSWNGMITFYIAVVIFGLWIACLLPILRTAARTETDRTPPLYPAEVAR
nr:hypothetical protein [Nocardia carnea]